MWATSVSRTINATFREGCNTHIVVVYKRFVYCSANLLPEIEIYVSFKLFYHLLALKLWYVKGCKCGSKCVCVFYLFQVVLRFTWQNPTKNINSPSQLKHYIGDIIFYIHVSGFVSFGEAQERDRIECAFVL